MGSDECQKGSGVGTCMTCKMTFHSHLDFIQHITKHYPDQFKLTNESVPAAVIPSPHGSYSALRSILSAKPLQPLQPVTARVPHQAQLESDVSQNKGNDRVCFDCGQVLSCDRELLQHRKTHEDKMPNELERMMASKTDTPEESEQKLKQLYNVYCNLKTSIAKNNM